MFFVSLLLNQVLGWMRTQSGTTSLRAILYMDEIFGYFPPVANPPSKLPLLTLLKQARAFGLGVVLATQNPVDLDYKGLANTGTWFIGRLQTERDKARVLEGLEGIATSTGQKFDKQQMEQLLAGLDKRIFLLNNVHDDAPELFETRWAMSYLRGPLTRAQIKLLMDPLKGNCNCCRTCSCTLLLLHLRLLQLPLNPASRCCRRKSRSTTFRFAHPVRRNADLSSDAARRGRSSLQQFENSRRDTAVDTTGCDQRWTSSLDWSQATPLDLPVEDLESEPQAEAQFAEVPAEATKAKSYATWQQRSGELGLSESAARIA